MLAFCSCLKLRPAENTFIRLGIRSQIVFQRCFAQSSAEKQMSILDSLYSDEQKDRILETFNKCSEHELQLKRQLNSHKALSIVKYRTDHGNFMTLSDVLRVPGMGMLGLQKVCNILKSVDYDSLQDMKLKQDFYKVKSQPLLSEEKCKNLKTLVALDTQIDRISWTKMDRNLNVQDWDHVIVFDKPIQKYDPAYFLEQMHHAIEKVPAGDIYVMESKIYRFPNLRIVPFLTNIRIMEAMLFTLLNKDFSSTDNHRVYFLPSVFVSKLFSLTVGGERVSGQHIIRDIRRQASDHGDVEVPKSFWDSYVKLESVQQEKYANCLLLALAFYKLIVLKTHSLSS